MKIVVSDLAFAGFKAKELVKLPNEYGIEFFYEFGKNHYWDKVLAKVGENRMLPLGMHGPCVSVTLANPEDTEFLGVFRKTLAYAQRCRAEYVVVHTNEQWSGEVSAIQDLVLERLKKIIDMAADYHVRILIENVGLNTNGTLLFPWKDYQKLLRKLPRSRALLDIGHAHINGWNIPECIRTLDSRLLAMHLHDNDGENDQHLAIGKGNIAWDNIFTAIRSLGGETRLILEYANIDMSQLIKNIKFVEKEFLA